MKWKMPNHGETRRRVKFAFFPVFCSDRTYRWLEKVVVVEQYFNNSNVYDSGWCKLECFPYVEEQQ